MSAATLWGAFLAVPRATPAARLLSAGSEPNVSTRWRAERSEQRVLDHTPQAGPAGLIPQAPYQAQEWCPSACSQSARSSLIGVEDWQFSAVTPKPEQLTAPEPCSLCEHPHLFIASIGGRTGSTTILSMLGAHPIVRLAGENKDVSNVYNSWVSVASVTAPKSQAEWGLQRVNNGTTVQTIPVATPHERGPVDPLKLGCSLRDFLLGVASSMRSQPAPPLTPILGFKDIDWTYDSIMFVRMLFPCSRWVFNVRNNATAEEASLREQFRNDAQAIAKVRQTKKQVLQLVADDAGKGDGWRNFVLPLEEFSTAAFNKLLRWMGETGCEFTGVVAANDQAVTQTLGGGDNIFSLNGATWEDAAALLRGRCNLGVVNVSGASSRPAPWPFPAFAAPIPSEDAPGANSTPTGKRKAKGEAKPKGREL